MAARMSSSVERGLALSARKPAASTSPSEELRSSLDTTSGAGTALRDTLMASSSSLGGITRAVLREVKRSMTSASASTEHKSRGQIGQPAATMIENKEALRHCKGMQMRGDYPPRRLASGKLHACRIRRTESV